MIFTFNLQANTVLFRKDINGLRAIAIIAVVLYHANQAWIPGGMAGVDVFFVISGFLMTSIIFKGIEQNKFSIKHFYMARANRIIPPLAVLCFTLLIVGWFCIPLFEHQVLTRHIGSSLGFFSNIVYAEELYNVEKLQESSLSLWLLHTWSLSVEWQFYIVYPLILTVMYQFLSIQTIKKTLILFAIVCFIMGLIASYTNAYKAYYLLHNRAWAMMFGGIAYLYPIKLVNHQKKLAEWLGLALIIGTYVFFPGRYIFTPWPGYFALFPVIGAFLVIQAQNNESVITGNAFFQYLGSCSYSIYLWHLPIILSVEYFELNHDLIYLAIVFSFLLGFVSHKYTEKMYFNTQGSFFYFLKSKPTIIISLTFLCSALMYATNTASS